MLLEKVQARGGRMTARDLQRTNQKKYRTAAEAEADLEALVTDRIGFWREVPPTERGGHPTREFVLRVTCDTTDTAGGDSVPDDPDGGDTAAAELVTEPSPAPPNAGATDGSVSSVTPSSFPDGDNQGETPAGTPEDWSPPGVTPADEQEGEL
jgi:hypothetical protein